MDISAESSKDVIDTWPKCIWSAAGGAGSDTIVETGGWGAADEHALGGPTFGVEALGGGVFGGAALGGAAFGGPDSLRAIASYQSACCFP